MKKWIPLAGTSITMVLLISVLWGWLLPSFQEGQYYTAQVTAPQVTTLYDQVLNLPGCGLGGTNSCAIIDGTTTSQTGKTVTIRRFVPSSGYVAVYFRDLGGTPLNADGGFSSSRASYETVGGKTFSLARGLQVFERGNVILEFDQPHDADIRYPTSYEFVISYLPHSEIERLGFLSQIQDNQRVFEQFKEDHSGDIDPLCDKLATSQRIPAACPQSARQQATGSSPQKGGTVTETGGVSDPFSLPELDFSGTPVRAPLLTVKADYIQAFIGEPVTIRLTTEDPDGKCGFFQYSWEKPRRFRVTDFKIDDQYGDLFFRPQQSGSYPLRVTATEVCGRELGNLSSNPLTIRILVNDKATAFSDLSSAPGTQNYLYDLYHIGSLKGYADGTMQPNKSINRAEFLKLIFETLQYRLPETVFSARYPDVRPTDWFAPYVHQADVLGVIKGYPDGRFHPERTVNLVEALKMAMMFTTLEIADSVEVTFGDVDYRDWYSRYVQTAYREGILEDITPGRNVYPNQPLTRAKAAMIIVRTFLFPVNHINYTNTDVLRKPDEFENFSSFDYKTEDSLR